MTDWIGQFDAHLEVHPPLDEQGLSRVPAKRGVLLLTAEGDYPLILLTAANLRARLRGRLQAPPDDQPHSRRIDWRQDTRKVLWKLADSHFETDLHYLALARVVWPGGFTKMLAYRPARFVHVDPAARVPPFVKVSRLLAPSGVCVGPFPRAKTAQEFIDIVVDVFGLCRDRRRLAQAPHAQPCAYRQMGRCVGVCDGSMTMDAYRELVARAARFAAGPRDEVRQQLEASMHQAAAEMRFEQAAAIRTRLERLAVLDGPAYARVADGEAFQFLFIQRGSRKAAKVFLVDRGLVVAADPLPWPLEVDRLRRTLDGMATLVAGTDAEGRYDVWRLALVSSYLHAGPQRQGLILRWRPDLTAEQLAAAMEASVERLRLGPAKRKASEGTSSSGK